MRNRIEEENPSEPLYSTRPAIQKFFQKHNPHVQLKRNGEILFHDGAVLEYSFESFGRMTPPPTDKYERRKAICKYWRAVAKQAEDAFNNLQQSLLGYSDGQVQEETDEAIETLKELRAAANKARSELRSAEKRRDDATPAWIVAKRRDDDRDKQQREKFRHRVSSVKL